MNEWPTYDFLVKSSYSEETKGGGTPGQAGGMELLKLGQKSKSSFEKVY